VLLRVCLQIPDSVPSIPTLPQLTDFHETWHEHYIIEGHFTNPLYNFVQSVMTLDVGAKFEEGAAQVPLLQSADKRCGSKAACKTFNFS
jgi:hypothetical protein